MMEYVIKFLGQVTGRIWAENDEDARKQLIDLLADHPDEYIGDYSVEQA